VPPQKPIPHAKRPTPAPAGSGYPTVVIPKSTKSKAAPSTGSAFNQFINQHPIMRDYADRIYTWAHTYGVDPVVMAALFWRESFAVAASTGQDPRTITSPTGAGVGIGQINPIHVGERTPWGATVTQSDLTNPEFNIRWSTWYFSQGLQKYGNADDAYAHYYNPNYTGAPLTSLLPKKYVPRSGLTTTEKASVSAQQSAATAKAKQTLTDPWVVLTPKGKLSFVYSDTPPKNALTFAGQPITRTGFNQTWTQSYADTFEAYTGRKATGKDIAQILRQSPSVPGLAQQLANRPTFQSSPIYKQHAKGFLAVGRSILGQTWNPSGDTKGIIKKAIVGNWDQATFEQTLRESKEYAKSPEFQANLDNFKDAYSSIYGQPDAAVTSTLKDRVVAGWSTEQLNTWLRQQPAYKFSAEYQTKSLSFLGQLGLITGAVPTLSEDQVNKILSSGDQLAAGAAPVTPTPGVTTPPQGSPQTGVTDVSSTGGYAPPKPNQPPYLGRH